ncbi:MAG: response regulator [Methylococcaceae bacterium]
MITMTQEPQEPQAAHQSQLILVALDNETSQQLMLRQLELLGMAAEMASNGIEALELWKMKTYALVLTDVYMTLMDGYELSVAIRSEEEKIGMGRTPIIALSFNTTKDERDHCTAAGMDDVLSKPVRLIDLKAMLAKRLPVAPQPVEICVLKEQVGDDPAFICEFLHNFRGTALKIGVEIEVAIREVRTNEAVAAAHKLKSSARSVGALRLGQLCEYIEQAGKASDNAMLAAALPRFKEELAAVETYLFAWPRDLTGREEEEIKIAEGLGPEKSPHNQSIDAFNAVANSAQKTLLVVDDDVFQHENIATALKNEKYCLLFATSGNEAMRMLHKVKPDLILMDIDMPCMNGLEVVRKIKAYPSFAGLPILMLTGRSEKSIVIESRKAGARDYIVKPFTRDILIAKIREVLRRATTK